MNNLLKYNLCEPEKEKEFCRSSKIGKMKSNIKKIEFIYETSWIKKEMIALYNSKDKSENYVKEQLKLYPDLGFDSCHILVIPKVTFENVFREMI